MFNAKKIEILIEANRLTKKEFCKNVDISLQTLDNTLKGSEIGSRKLERIADFFKVAGKTEYPLPLRYSPFA